jgi:hypothetical protein
VTTTEEYLRRFLLADAGIKEVVRAVSYNIVPQNKEAPYIFFQQAGAVDDIALDDSAGVPTRPRYDIECWDSTPSGAIALKNMVQAKLHKFRGTFGDSVASTTVKGIFAEDVNDDYVANGGGEDEGMHSSALNAEVVL